MQRSNKNSNKKTHGASREIGWEPFEAMWLEQERWPDDSPGYVFLGRAVANVGYSLFGDQWTGKEPVAAPLPTISSSTQEIDHADDVYAAALIRKFRPELWRDQAGENLDWDLELRLDDAGEVKFPLRGSSGFTWSPSDEVWSVAVQLAAEKSAAAARACNRWRLLKEEFSTQLLLGQMASFARPIEGGALSQIPSDFWRSERISRRFETGMMNLKDPFETKAPTSSAGFIYIGEEALTALPHFRRRSILTEDFYRRLSPYMRLALDVAAELNLSPDNQPTVETVRTKLRKRWPELGEPTSENLISALGTLLRERGRGKAEGK